jgi:APA family basic amino acid/polyamine antiporter
MGTLLAFAMIALAVLILRIKQPDLERPFKVPFLPVVSTLGVGFNIFLMMYVRKETWIAFLIWSSIGILVYFLYSRKNSKLNDWEKEQALLKENQTENN